MGMMEMDYTIEGNEIKLAYPGGMKMVYMLLDDGSIKAPMIGRMYKK